MGTVRVDASQLKAFSRKLDAAIARSNMAVMASVKKGAQNIKNDVRKDLASSSNSGFRQIPIAYEIKSTFHMVEADIAPTVGGAGNLDNIAFFGTARGGGTHRFYEHGEAELDTTAEYVRKAATL